MPRSGLLSIFYYKNLIWVAWSYLLVSLDYGPNDNGDLDTFIIIPEKQEELQRKIFESVKKLRYKATICEPPNDDEVVYMPDNPLPVVPAELD